MGIASEIAKLDALRRSGAINQAEFDREKAKLLASSASTGGWAQPTPVKKSKRPAVIGLVVVVVAVIVIAALTGGGGPSANIKNSVVAVSVLDGSEVRIYIDWTNTGEGTGSTSCVINTNVYNQFGDLTTTEVTSTGPNGNLKPGQTQKLYQDQGVTAGDAQYVKASDVSIMDCS
jgi:hypothetical protein